MWSMFALLESATSLILFSLNALLLTMFSLASTCRSPLIDLRRNRACWPLCPALRYGIPP